MSTPQWRPSGRLLSVGAPMIFVLLWSTGYVGARYGLPYAEPLSFTSLRFFIVILLLAVALLWRRKRLPRSPTMWAHLAISGILIHACFVGGIYLAIDRGVDLSVAALIAGMQPLLTALIVVVFFGERLSARQWSGFVLGFFGLGLVVSKSLAIGEFGLLAIAACFVGLFGITLGTLYQKRYVVDIDLFSGSMIQFCGALIPCALWALCFEDGRIEWNLTFVLTLGWLCLVLSIGAISILLFLIREGAAARVSSLFYLVPPVTALQAYVLFGEQLTRLQLFGMAGAAFGVLLVNSAPPSLSKKP